MNKSVVRRCLKNTLDETRQAGKLNGKFVVWSIVTYDVRLHAGAADVAEEFETR